MKLSNFKMMRLIGKGPLDWEYYASVDVTSGFWLFKKTENRIIHRKYGSFWRFADTGEFTPACQAEQLFAAHEAQRKLKEAA